MRHIQSYSLFEANQELTPEQIEFLNKCTGGKWILNPNTGLVDIDGDFNCAETGLKDFLGISFGSVDGDFECSINELTSLKGAPQQVKGSFYCPRNKLTSLKGAPQEIGWDFYCYENSLTSLDEAPQKVKGEFSCYDNNLTSLEGSPREVGGNFYCYENPLTSLEGAPEEVKEEFFCTNPNVPDVPTGDWNPNGWLKAARDKDPIYLTLLPPEKLNSLIKKDPNKWLEIIKPYLKDPDFQDWVSKLDLGDFDADALDTYGTLGSLGI